MKIITFLSIIFLTGCTTIRFDSAYNQTTKVNIKRAVIVTDEIYKDGFLRDFSDSLSKAFKGQNIQSLVIYKDALSFVNDKEIEKSENDFNADVIISLKRFTNNLAKVKSGYIYNGAVYYLSIRKRGEESEYWKALITTEREENNYQRRINRTVNNIIEKVKKDTM